MWQYDYRNRELMDFLDKAGITSDARERIIDVLNIHEREMSDLKEEDDARKSDLAKISSELEDARKEIADLKEQLRPRSDGPLFERPCED